MPGTTSFPTALDTFPDLDVTSQEDDPANYHDVVHNNEAAAIAALQTKVGIDGSADPDSLDMKVAALLAGAVPEAPVDGTPYARQDADWAPISSSGGGPYITGIASAQTVGDTFNLTLTLNNSGTTAKWEVVGGALPGGGTINASTGAPSGALTTAGNFSATIAATIKTGTGAGATCYSRQDFAISPSTAVTWNPADCSSNITLSGSNLIATGQVATVLDTVRATTSQSTGKKTFFVKLDAPNAYFTAGLCTATDVLSGKYPGADSDSFGVQAGFSSGGGVRKYNGGSPTTITLTALTANQWCGVHVDFDAGKIWFDVNGSSVGNPGAGTGEDYTFTPNTTYFAATGAGNSAVATGWFGAGSPPLTIPSGFSAWDL